MWVQDNCVQEIWVSLCNLAMRMIEAKVKVHQHLLKRTQELKDGFQLGATYLLTFLLLKLYWGEFCH